ncbi:MAG: ribosome biogenesis GTP-binding protein YihA/YsxC [Flavobacteriaceae bacterium]|jgi:GTP-binding protein|nr:YihA family ribosome biogenesis GTP-binding protein [Flavobacteriaceae bacterium]
MQIKSAKFYISSQKEKDCPKTIMPEYAFIGRSNVGKSSLINMITNQKKLAKTSSTPGKTQLINHFLINNSWYIVDLPGYGYAKTSKSNKKHFQKSITEYFKKRRQLVSAFILIDIRHSPLKIDLEFIIWLATNKIPFSIIFTKTDKISKIEIDNKLLNYKKELEKNWEILPEFFISSSEKYTGKEDILNYIDKINQSII